MSDRVLFLDKGSSVDTPRLCMLGMVTVMNTHMTDIAIIVIILSLKSRKQCGSVQYNCCFELY